MKDYILYPPEITEGYHLYSFTEFGMHNGNIIHVNSFAYGVSPYLDKTFLKFFGAQSITITSKFADKMQCFLW